MINSIAWKTYFVFMCFNIAFVPLVSPRTTHDEDVLTDSQVYFFLPETNGWKLETLDTIFNESHEKGENPVFVEKRWRKNGWKHRRDSTAARDSIQSDSEKTQVGEGKEGETRHVEEKSQEV